MEKINVTGDHTDQQSSHLFMLCFLKRLGSVKRALDLILNKIDEINIGARPTTIVIDFEKSEEQALRTAIPTAKIHGCFFSF